MGVESIVIEKLKASNKKITKSQKLVADYFLKNAEKVTYMTANQIGMEVGVSETTVIRFALSLGYKRFSDFQEDFRNEVIGDRTVQRLQKANLEFENNSPLTSSFKKDIENLEKTLSHINEDEFNEFISLLCKAKKIFIIGFRSSMADAFYLAFSLNAMLGNVKPITNTGMDLEDCLQTADEESVIIAFSYPRYTTFTLESVHYLKEEKKCTIVAITDSIHSPIIPHSDFVFLTEIDSYTPKDSHVAGIAFSNAIISAVGQVQKERVETNLNNLEKYFNKINIFYER
ncbi:MurR/RpiR family transcriptional regulator [Alkalihalobacterium elongatum]|uniref:MurR/RpiR family transcriptional regulator n=1 Tax=Alkalihalobacterium elongatum TaxID=2675466 RepID=UPI001C1F757D|nr:MurR/RpiR family transcriptional regulator [Alkalihalobacterium elongatum]